ncbi:hypothetical protein [Dictyobacter kobayashii]|uniref:hypothetical protein n=1 Tax=Dictyobacter kobayashii TaxID=2014872 RepID=UPI000F844E15|nr:hypothetical protein [Dictyobacter kobayashii]
MSEVQKKNKLNYKALSGHARAITDRIRLALPYYKDLGQRSLAKHTNGARTYLIQGKGKVQQTTHRANARFQQLSRSTRIILVLLLLFPFSLTLLGDWMHW